MGWGTEIVFNTSVRHTGPHSLEFKHTGGDAYLDSEPIPIGNNFGAEGAVDRAPTPVQYGLIAKAVNAGDKIVVEYQGSMDWPQNASWTLINSVTFALGTGWREIRRNPAGNTIGYNWVRVRVYRPNGGNVGSVYVDRAWLGQIEPMARLYMGGNQAVGAGAWTAVALATPTTVGWGTPAGSQIKTASSIVPQVVGNNFGVGQAGLYVLSAFVNVERQTAGVAQVQARIYDVSGGYVVSQAGPFPTLTGQAVVVPVASQLWDVMNPPNGGGADVYRQFALEVYSDVAINVLGGLDLTSLTLMRVGGRT